MKEGKYLSEAINYTEIKHKRLNMVVANTGQGKTTMATKVLPQQLNIENKSRILYLIDTVMGRDMLLKKDGALQEFPSTDKNKITIMTYAKFGSLLKKYQIWSAMFDLVVADEFHNLYKYAKIDMSKIVKNNPNFAPETLSMILSRESNSYKAMEAIKRWVDSPSIYIVAMTATPENFLEKDKELNQLIDIIKAKEQLVAYEILARHTYTNAEEVLIGEAEEGEKRLIFTHNIKQAKDFKSLVETNTDRKAVALWSPTNGIPMDLEQNQVRQHLIDNESFPDDLDDLFLTEAYTTGWNLVDKRVTTTIIHSGNETISKQFAGRNRQDIQKLYIYDSTRAENEKRIVRRNKIEENYEIPESYLNRKLGTEDRKQLIIDINFPKCWTSLKKWIENNSNYILEKKRIRGNDYYIISKIDVI